MQTLASNEHVASLSLERTTIGDGPAIGDTLAFLLEANSAIFRLVLELGPDDPERPQLMELAALDERLQLHEDDSTDDASDSN